MIYQKESQITVLPPTYNIACRFLFLNSRVNKRVFQVVRSKLPRQGLRFFYFLVQMTDFGLKVLDCHRFIIDYLIICLLAKHSYQTYVSSWVALTARPKFPSDSFLLFHISSWPKSAISIPNIRDQFFEPNSIRSSVQKLSSCHILVNRRNSRKIFLCQPFASFSSIFLSVTNFSIPMFLISCPINHSCRFLMVAIIALSSRAIPITVSLLNFLFHGILNILR